MRRKPDGNSWQTPRCDALSRWVWSCLMTGGGLILGAAIQSRQFPFLALIGLLPLLRSIQRDRPRQAATHGALWGVSVALTLLLTGQSMNAAIGLLPIMTTAFAAGGAWVTRRSGFSPFVLGVGWILLELALQPLAPNRGLLAGTQSAGVFTTVAGAMGHSWASFLLVFIGAWLVKLLARFECTLQLSRATLGLDLVGALITWHKTAFVPCVIRSSAPRGPPLRK